MILSKHENDYRRITWPPTALRSKKKHYVCDSRKTDQKDLTAQTYYLLTRCYCPVLSLRADTWLDFACKYRGRGCALCTVNCRSRLISASLSFCCWRSLSSRCSFSLRSFSSFHLSQSARLAARCSVLRLKLTWPAAPATAWQTHANAPEIYDWAKYTQLVWIFLANTSTNMRIWWSLLLLLLLLFIIKRKSLSRH